MSEVADLLMPKLGLTMTEGRIAAWGVAAGQRFRGGDVIVVIETDKIASEVEAPCDGVLIAHLHEDGAVVSVGSAIARWTLDSGAASVPLQPSRDGIPQSRPRTVSPSPAIGPAAASTRLIATPYARKLAREYGVELAAIVGAEAGKRIKGADVMRARETAAASRSALIKQPTTLELQSAAPADIRPDASLAMVQIDIVELRQIDARLGAGQPAPCFELVDYLLLAVLRTTATSPQVDAPTGVVLAVRSRDGAGYACIDPVPQQRLALSAVHEHRIASTGITATSARHAGHSIALHVAEAGIGLFAPYDDAFAITLGVAEDGLRDAITLAATYQQKNCPHDACQHLLLGVKALLEEPLALLAS